MLPWKTEGSPTPTIRKCEVTGKKQIFSLDSEIYVSERNTDFQKASSCLKIF